MESLIKVSKVHRAPANLLIFLTYLPFPVAYLILSRTDHDILSDLQVALRVGVESKHPHLPISAPNACLYLTLDLQ